MRAVVTTRRCLQSSPAVAMLLAASLAAAELPNRSVPVGVPTQLSELVLPGSQLEPKPLDDPKTPIVLRMTGVFAHGSDFRYNLVYYGLEPGEFDLRDYLRRKDGSATDNLPPLKVTIRPSLPPGQIEPNRLESRSFSGLGGYRAMLWTGAVVWIVGLAAILLVGRHRKNAAELSSRPQTLADRLRPLVEGAVAGELSHSQLAELERSLVALWRKRLRLDSMKASEAIDALREHEVAGGLLRQLEEWLHRPGGEAEVNIASLLAPYEELPAEEFSLESEAAEVTA